MILGDRFLQDDFYKYAHDVMVTNFWKNYGEYVRHTGIARDFALQIMTKQHALWWKDDDSPWRHHHFHPSEDPSMTAEYYVKRAINLCSSDTVHSFFGLSFLDLMSLDPDTFEMIEKAVDDIEAARDKALQKPT